MNIKIDDEFKQLCPPISENERQLLRTSISSEGQRDAIILWNKTIVDGHNRFEICSELGIVPRTTEKAFNDRDDVKRWILNNQLGRRNLGRIQAAYLRGSLYLATKKTGRRGRKMTVGKSTHDILGAMFCLSPSAIRSDVNLTEAINSLCKEAREYVMRRDVPLQKQHIIDLAQLKAESQTLIVDKLNRGDLDSLRKAILRLRPGGKNAATGTVRCKRCGGKLAFGTLTCLACDISAAEVHKRIESPKQEQPLPEGWQDRLSEIRDRKRVVGELGGESKIMFHVDELTKAIPRIDVTRGSALHFALVRLLKALKAKVGRGAFPTERDLAS